ncbi:MAG: hypothetical protein PVI25_07110 [Gammaproteobacteria bacterium]
MTSQQPSHPEVSRPWIRRELILAGVLLPIGFFVLPVAIYFTGQALLGDYSQEGAGVGQLYADIFGDLATGFLPAWVLVLSPWLGIQLLRLAALPVKRKRSPAPPQRHPDVT